MVTEVYNKRSGSISMWYVSLKSLLSNIANMAPQYRIPQQTRVLFAVNVTEFRFRLKYILFKFDFQLSAYVLTYHIRVFMCTCIMILERLYMCIIILAQSAYVLKQREVRIFTCSCSMILEVLCTYVSHYWSVYILMQHDNNEGDCRLFSDSVMKEVKITCLKV